MNEHPGCTYVEDGRTLHTFCPCCGDLLHVRLINDEPPLLELDCPAGCPTEDISAAYAEHAAERHRERRNGSAPSTADAAPGGASGRAVQFTSAALIRPEPTSWLWRARVPIGAVTLLAGRQGLGIPS